MRRSGVFINLDRSADRRAAMQAQLQAAGIDWVQRLPAVNGAALQVPADCRITPAEYGCWLSHLQAIEAAPADQAGFVFEDDVELSPDLPALLQPGQLDALGTHDLVLLDCQPECSSATIAQLWRCLEGHLADPRSMLAGTAPRRVRGVDLVDAAPLFRWGLQAYVVTPRGRPRLAALLREALAHGPVQPVDLLVGEALRQRRLHAVVTVPFLATPRLDSHAGSTIGAAAAGDTQALASALRRLLFAGPVEGIEAFAQPLLARTRATSPEMELAGRLLAQLFAVEAREGALEIGRRAG